MSTARSTRCLTRLAATSALLLGLCVTALAAAGGAHAAPYLSCPNGYVVPWGVDCPTELPGHTSQPPPLGGGGGGSVLGDLLGRLGLGGLTGGLVGGRGGLL